MLAMDEAVGHIAAGAGELIQVMSERVTVKAHSQSAAGGFALTEVATPPQGGPPGLHRHPDQETFYVLDGHYRFDTLEREQPHSREATAGDVVHIPSRVWHNYKNVGQTPGKLLVVLQPGSLVDFFRELGVPISDPANPPRPSGPPDRARVAAITHKHHVEMLDQPALKGA